MTRCLLKPLPGVWIGVEKLDADLGSKLGSGAFLMWLFQAAVINLALRRSRLARPPIWRLRVFSLQMFPSV